MSTDFPITTKDIVAISLKEIGKQLPVLGAVVGAHDAVFNKIEVNRIKEMLVALVDRLDQLEKKTGKPMILDTNSGPVLLFACDQARHDPLAGAKADEYAAITVKYMTAPENMNEVVEILEALRRLSVDDLKILYRFVSGDEVLPNRRVDEIVGYNAYTEPIGGQAQLAAKMAAAFPCFRRLEGIGILYLADTHGGGIVHDIGPFSQYMQMFAFLSSVGLKLVAALPK